MRVRPEALHRFPGGLLAAAIVMAGCARAAPIPVACVSPRLVPSALMVGDGALDRGFPGGVSLVDVDGDGDLDLMATRGYSPAVSPITAWDRSMLYLNDGTGRFTHDLDSPLSNADNPDSGSTWGDVDRDGDPDAFVNTQHGRPDRFYRNLGGGRFAREDLGDATSTPGSNFSSSWVDIDGDGDLDLFVGGPTLELGQPNLVYRNDDGAFVRVTGLPIEGGASNAGAVLWADLDGDGDQDLVAAYSDILRQNDLPPAPREWPQVFRNEGGWRFAEIAGQGFADSTWSAVAAALGDVDGDGDLDLYLGHSRGTDGLFLNDGAGRFSHDPRFAPPAHEGAEATSATFVDFDLDGDLDVVATAYDQGIALWENDGAGGLTRVRDVALTDRRAHYWSAASGDIDGDRDVDLVIGNWGVTEHGDYITILTNESARCGTPLHVRLRDRHGAADPIGARVTLVTTSRAGERRQVRESMGQTTFRGQGADPFFFAVPRGERIARLEVRWPDGSRETRPVSSAPDRVLEIRQR